MIRKHELYSPRAVPPLLGFPGGINCSPSPRAVLFLFSPKIAHLPAFRRKHTSSNTLSQYYTFTKHRQPHHRHTITDLIVIYIILTDAVTHVVISHPHTKEQQQQQQQTHTQCLTRLTSRPSWPAAATAAAEARKSRPAESFWSTVKSWLETQSGLQHCQLTQFATASWM